MNTLAERLMKTMMDDKKLERRITAWARPKYATRDTMHDFSHIERIRRRALDFAEPQDHQVVRYAVLLHGVIGSTEAEVRGLFQDEGAPEDLIEAVIKAAYESHVDATPETPAGAALHDAHLLEGDRGFLVTKGLVTGSARGQSLSETLDAMDYFLGRGRCTEAQRQAEYERRMAYARAFVASLRAELQESP